jgi:iron-sulfur cluster insertion protein
MSNIENTTFTITEPTPDPLGMPAGNIPLLNVTDAAANKLHEIILEENNPDLKLRISITGGGCSGFQYAFDLDEIQQETDIIIEKRTTNNIAVYILVDPMSLMYLTGAEIDFKKTTAGEEFVIRNPHAKTTCGCGSSFSI